MLCVTFKIASKIFVKIDKIRAFNAVFECMNSRDFSASHATQCDPPAVTSRGGTKP